MTSLGVGIFPEVVVGVGTSRVVVVGVGTSRAVVGVGIFPVVMVGGAGRDCRRLSALHPGHGLVIDRERSWQESGYDSGKTDPEVALK